ncbi:MAG: hypothetical protein K0S07_814 [Chlamydiales bacterium]|nr:hypothetical protein [Chlamydiales bacterium]
MLERSYDDTVDLVKTTPTVVSFSAIGPEGVLGSANLSGTISTAGTAVTGTGTSFLTDFIVGDVITADDGTAASRVITAIASNTGLTIRSSFPTIYTNANYRRGGQAPNGMYYLYAIAYPDGSNATFAFSNRSFVSGDDFLADLPTGYTKYRQLPIAFPLNQNSVILSFTVHDWPNKPIYSHFSAFGSVTNFSDTRLFNGTPPLALANLSCSHLVPKISSVALVNCTSKSASNSSYYLADKTFGAAAQGVVVSQKYATSNSVYVFYDPIQRIIQHKISAANAISLYITGFIVTEDV